MSIGVLFFDSTSTGSGPVPEFLFIFMNALRFGIGGVCAAFWYFWFGVMGALTAGYWLQTWPWSSSFCGNTNALSGCLLAWFGGYPLIGLVEFLVIFCCIFIAFLIAPSVCVPGPPVVEDGSEQII